VPPLAAIAGLEYAVPLVPEGSVDSVIVNAGAEMVIGNVVVLL
jgi:hypothetical protein